MRFLNEHDIEEALRLAQRTPEFTPYVQYLSDWKDEVNANSDGWPYWTPAVKAAAKLIVQVEGLTAYIRHKGLQYPAAPRPEVAAFQRALIPIKSFATKHKLVAPRLKSLHNA